MAEQTPLVEALRYWAADREEISVIHIKTASLHFDAGFPGTDVTPAEPPSFRISYEVKREVTVEIEPHEVGPFMEELARLALRRNF